MTSWILISTPPSSSRGADNSSCLRKSPSTTSSSDSRECRVLDTGSNFTDGGIGTNIGVQSVGICHTDFSTDVSGREQDFSLGLSGREYQCLFRAVSIWTLSRDCGATRSRSSLASPSSLRNMHLAGPISFGSVLRVTSRVWKQPASARALSWKFPSRSVSSSRISRCTFVPASVVVALVARFFDACRKRSSPSSESLASRAERSAWVARPLFPVKISMWFSDRDRLQWPITDSGTEACREHSARTRS